MTPSRTRRSPRAVAALLTALALAMLGLGASAARAADPAPTLTITGMSGHYHSGNKISLGVAQTPDTGNSHYHWHTTCPGGTEQILSGAKLTVELTASSKWHGCQVVVKLFGDGHAVVAESPAKTIDVDDHGPSPALPTLAVSGVKPHYHSGDPITLAVAKTPSNAAGTLAWYQKCAADTSWKLVAGTTDAFGVAASPTLDGCQVVARLIGHAPYDTRAESAPVTIAVDDHGHGEPVATTLAASGLKDHYHPGDPITLQATQTPATDLDHYHWFVRCGSGAWTIDPNNATGTWTTTTDLGHEGCEVQVKLYDDAHDVVAESAPVVLRVRTHAAAPVPVTPTPVAPTPVAPAPAPTPPATPAPAAAATTAKVTPSAVRRVSVLRRQRVLRTVVRLNGTGRVTVRSTISAAAAKRLGLRVPKGARTVALGTGRATKSKAGTAIVRVALGAKQRKALGRLRGRLRITHAVSVRTTDGKTLTSRARQTVRG